MKQVEKLDFILNFLYSKKFDGNYYGVADILMEKEVRINFDEAFSLGKRLSDDGLVSFMGTFDEALVSLNSYGVDYVEGDSYSHRGQSVHQNNINITGSTNTNILQNANNVEITQLNNQTEEIINLIKNHLDKLEIESQKLTEIYECLEEIQASSDKNIAPKFAFRSLLTMTSEISSLGSLLLTLSQSLGIS